MTALLPVAFAALVLAAMLLPSRADRFRGALGLPACALGAASAPLLGDLRGPDPALWISTGMLLLGPAALLLAAWRARPRLHTGLITAPAAALAAVLALLAAWPLLRLGGALPALLSAGAIAFGAAFLYLGASALGAGRPVRWVAERLPWSRGGAPWGTRALIALVLVLGMASLRWSLWLRLWQPVGFGVGALLAWCAVALRRPALALAAVGLATCFVAPDLARVSWVGLAATALMVRPTPWVAAALAGAFGYVALPGLLDGEVLLTVVLVGAATALLAVLAEEARLPA